MQKNILIIGINSELALRTLEELDGRDYKIYATSRHVGLINKDIHEFYLDVCEEIDFINLKEKIYNLKFDTIINFTGLAIAGAVEELNETDFKKQFDVNLFGLLRIIKYICPYLEKNGKFINISSMAQYGIFPFLSPYSISKAAADILLNMYSIESNVKTISIRPGAIATKFWESSIKNNENHLKNDTKFKYEKEFLLKNAQNNSLHALSPIYTAKKIAQIIEAKNPKSVYNIGLDAKIAKLTRFLPQDFVNFIIKTTLKHRISKEK